MACLYVVIDPILEWLFMSNNYLVVSLLHEKIIP